MKPQTLEAQGGRCLLRITQRGSGPAQAPSTTAHPLPAVATCLPLPSDPAPPPSQDPLHLVLMAPFSPQVLSEHGFGLITTDIREGQTFYYAEDYHQQYLSKNPEGYCGLGGTGVSCPLGIKK